ncbi:MAG: hypothetical protein MK116_08225 [Phycisphaerales bacterium]|nr:hypothetical protein [Phycisphaerales bacterium]
MTHPGPPPRHELDRHHIDAHQVMWPARREPPCGTQESTLLRPGHPVKQVARRPAGLHLDTGQDPTVGGLGHDVDLINTDLAIPLHDSPPSSTQPPPGHEFTAAACTTGMLSLPDLTLVGQRPSL